VVVKSQAASKPPPAPVAPMPPVAQPSTPPTTYSDALARNLCSYIISGMHLVCHTSLTPLSFNRLSPCVRVVLLRVPCVSCCCACADRCRSELRPSGVVQVSHVHARRRQPGLLSGMR
jgi:hypothetical protein